MTKVKRKDGRVLMDRSKKFMLRLSEEDHRALRILGGTRWVRAQIEKSVNEVEMLKSLKE